MSIVDNVQDKVQAKVDELQAKVHGAVDSAQSNVTEAIDNAQAKFQETVNSVQEKVDAVEDKAESFVAKIREKIVHSFEYVEAVIVTSGLTPSNLISMVKVVVGKQVETKPIVLPFLRSLVAVNVSVKPSCKEINDAVEAAIKADEANDK